MSHLEPGTLARYNSLTDPNLQSYFSSERIRSHLKRAGLVSGRGEVLSDAEYRTRLSRREHRKHVQHMLAENIVNRAIDMERSRNAGMKRQVEMVAKAALVNDIRESRRRIGGNSAGLMSHSIDMAFLSLDSSWSQPQLPSTNYHSGINDDYTHIPRLQSANASGNRRLKSPSKTGNRRALSRQRPKSAQRPSSAMKYPDATQSSPPCQITMVYYGPHTKVDYDRMVFSDADEVMVMQQHCGGENLIVYKNYLKPGAEFTFNSRRHAEYPFGLSMYVKGLIDSRISTCCEYKHRHGVRLGGDRGHFAIVSVAGSEPCIKCRFEKQARLDKYAQPSKDKEGKREKPLTVSINVSDEPKNKQTPVQIPVRHTSISNDSYAEDFDDGEKPKKHSKRSSQASDSMPKVAPRPSKDAHETASEQSDDTFNILLKPDPSKKTWQVIFHPSNIPTGNFHTGSNRSLKRFLLKFSFIAADEEDETESYEIDMKPFMSESKSAKPHSFPTKLKHIGRPEQIRLRMLTSQDDDDDDNEEEEDIKWHLDHIEVIDPETQSHFIFPCKQWIRPLQEKYLQLSQEYSDEESRRKGTSGKNGSGSSPPTAKTRKPMSKIEPKHKIPSRSPTPTHSPNVSKPQHQSSRKLSSDQDSDESTARKTKKAQISARSSTSSQSSKPPQKPMKPSQKASSDDDSDQSIHGQTPKRDVRPRSSTPTNTSKISKAQKQQPRRNSSSDDSDRSTPKMTPKPKTSSSSNGSKPPQKPIKHGGQASSDDDNEAPTLKPKQSSGSSTPTHSPKISKQQNPPAKRTVADDDSDQSTSRKTPKTKVPSPPNESTHRKSSDSEDKVHYRMTIHPSEADEGEFNPAGHGRIFVRVNNHTIDINLTKKTDRSCPTFESGVKQTFDIDLTQDKHETLKRLTIGYVNKERQARQWKIDKIVMVNTETGKQTVFPCKESLQRNDANFRAERTLEAQSEPSDREDGPTGSKVKSSRSTDDDGVTPVKHQTSDRHEKERSPSFRSMGDDEANYKEIFKKLDPNDKLELGSQPRTPPPRPKTRRGRQDPIEQNDSSTPVIPPLGLDNLTDRSHNHDKHSAHPSSTEKTHKLQSKDHHTPGMLDSTEEED